MKKFLLCGVMFLSTMLLHAATINVKPQTATINASVGDVVRVTLATRVGTKGGVWTYELPSVGVGLVAKIEQSYDSNGYRYRDGDKYNADGTLAPKVEVEDDFMSYDEDEGAEIIGTERVLDFKITKSGEHQMKFKQSPQGKVSPTGREFTLTIHA